MRTVEIMGFLRARLNEDEAAALSIPAEGRPMEVDQYLSWFVSGRAIGDRSGYVITYDVALDAARDHIARHDPARVLREVEAKRDIITAAAYWLEHGDRDAKVQATQTLESLSAVYADHPDAPDWLKP